MVRVKALMNAMLMAMMARKLMSSSRRRRRPENTILEEHDDNIMNPTLRTAKSLSRGVGLEGAKGDTEPANEHAKPGQVMGRNRPDKPAIEDHCQLLERGNRVNHGNHHRLCDTD